jgi:hypothetical protein
MTALAKCDHCGAIVPASSAQEVGLFDARNRNSTAYGRVTYPYAAGASRVEAVVKCPVDLCGDCRSDLHDFFQNVPVARREATA